MKWYEDLSSVAKKFGVSPEEILKFNGLESEQEARSARTLKIPQKGVVSSMEAEAAGKSEVSGRPEGSGISEVPKAPEGPKVPEVSKNQRAQENQEVTERHEGYEVSGVPEVYEASGKIFGPEVNMALVLPFTGEGYSDSYYDFYSGVLMAVRDLGNAGIKTDLSVFDYNNDGIRFQKTDLDRFDFILGPISEEQLSSVEDITPRRTVLVSPLDPKCISLADSCANFIQAPASTERQYEDAAQWLKEELRQGDKVLLLKESRTDSTSIERYLKALGVEYKEISYNILEGRNVLDQMQSYAEGCNVLRAVIASSSEAFVNDAVRNLSLMAYRGSDVVLYSASKIHNFSTIEAEALHNVKLHMSTTYFVDYDNDRIKNFLLTYRALFSGEPGPFAYQGYDIASCLISARSRYRGLWRNRIMDETYHGLQINYRFVQSNGCGLINNAIRRVVYDKDFSITLQN